MDVSIKLKSLFAGALLLAAQGSSANAADLRLIGSGASFPFPIYSAWFKSFSKATEGVTVDYQAKGSGAGIQDLINATVDFAASDAAMTPDQISKVTNGVVLLPMTAGEIVLAYNLPGQPKDLKLPRDVYPEIFLGKITNWSDPRIAAANPGLKLPDMPITVVRRSDASGTNFVFTKHLSAISPAFKDQVGFGTTVNWPQSDKIVAAPKNDGVTATIKQTPGAIGYIEWGYAKLTKADVAVLQNKAGNYVAAGGEGGPLALASVDFPPDLIAWVDDPKDPKAYPIASFTWMLFYQKQDPQKAENLRKLVAYGLTEGQKLADSMGYIPLPASVIEKVKAAAVKIQ
ncbi:phosphate ABC transporter, periplasmic phosphate-binding protein [Methylocella silvestris BL2]|uniref:Phosphate-binding protein PstS n=1 Tax=Methylocella silvestris (strain DSM 15510 / CIP 108128 / LMG 27833 / NCIMB 13906 / BL2) TaxID=395965 RepID=B8EQ86_METSB|nr:phosphate ABC transporter substrate-binding protein PstS [Methylocella silvestris]ACK51576.1 phosphate ABC transporter, periplasmic phosphate-binding protein [Methylocella silvestris BL2]